MRQREPDRQINRQTDRETEMKCGQRGRISWPWWVTVVVSVFVLHARNDALPCLDWQV